MSTDQDFTRQLLASLKTADTSQLTQQDALRNEALAALDRLGGLTVKDDSVRFDGDNLVLPGRFDGNLLAAAEFIKEIHESEEEEFAFGRTFKYRPWDGAAAFQRALYSVFGTTGLGKAVHSMFGKRPPQLVSVSVSPTETLQVPWGRVSMPPLNATFDLGADMDEEYGLLFRLNVTAPKKMRKKLEGFFDVVQKELQERSIYKGNAFNGAAEPEFLDLSGIKEEEIVYSDEVLAQLNANLWSLIEHTATMRRLGIPLKRAVLLEGPFGTGKSMAGAITAKRAKENGWTFILARPGKDDVFEVLNTAKLYAPAVVQFEDIDVIASKGSSAEISRLLDALDGIGNKTNGVVALFTTNYVENLQKGVLRPGRIDSIIHIGELDRNGMEKLIKAVVKPEILGDLDYDVIYAQVKGFLPAFVKETVDRAVRYSVSRNAGKPSSIETDDIVNSAIGLQRQLELMNNAQEGQTALPTLDSAFKGAIVDAANEAVTATLNRAQLLDYDDDVNGRIRVKK